MVITAENELDLTTILARTVTLALLIFVGLRSEAAVSYRRVDCGRTPNYFRDESGNVMRDNAGTSMTDGTDQSSCYLVR